MTVVWQLQALGVAGILLVVIGVAITAHATLGRDTWLTRQYRQYTRARAHRCPAVLPTPAR